MIVIVLKWFKQANEEIYSYDRLINNFTNKIKLNLQRVYQIVELMGRKDYYYIINFIYQFIDMSDEQFKLLTLNTAYNFGFKKDKIVKKVFHEFLFYDDIALVFEKFIQNGQMLD